MRGALMLGFGKSKKQLETKVAELENRLNNLSWHDMSSEQWGELFGAIPASAGIAVTPVSAKRSTAVYACTNLIAGAFAITTLKFYEKKSGDERVEIDHDLWWLFNREPNPTLTASSLWDWTVSDKLLRGDGLIELHRNRKGDVEAISNVARDSAMIERSKSSKFRLNYHVDDVEKKRGIFQEDLLHIPGPGFNGVNGESVIKYAARDAVSTALAADRFSGSFFANGAHPSVVIEYPQGVAPKQEQIDNLRTQFEERYTGNDNH
ncbi:MAG TPA: phage portal protein, partial [Nitrosomonas sp.]|nr:phage portal protein [Nitrosomonas sp.]